MASSINKQFLSGSFWGIFVKIVDAIIKFFTVPILVAYFGKGDYGLIVLAVSLHTYLQILDMGMNVGNIRYFSIWLSQKDYQRIAQVSQSSIVFYGSIGIVNAIVIIWLAYNPSIFDIVPSQEENFKLLLLILSGGIIFNWISHVIILLLTANNQYSDVNKSMLISNLANFAAVILTVQAGYSLSFYFLLYTISNLVILPINILYLRAFPISIKILLRPQWHWIPFKEILFYSISIFAMGLFQASANHLRPLLMTNQAIDGTGILTDYKILQTISGMITAFGAVIIQVFLPVVSKLYAEGGTENTKGIIFEGTKISTIFIGFCCFGLITCATEILSVYMGKEYEGISFWLIVWILTLFISMHNSPVASMVIAVGKIKLLAYITAFSCILSLPITYFLVEELGVGAGVMGYYIYTIIMIVSYYLYYIPYVLKYSSISLLKKSVLPSFLVGSISYGVVCALEAAGLFTSANSWVLLFVKGCIFSVLYLLLIIYFVIPISKIKETIQNLRKK